MKMNGRRVLSALLVMISLILLIPGLAAAEANARELEYAYVDTDASFLIRGEKVTATVIVPDTKGLTFEFTLYRSDDRATQKEFEYVTKQKESKKNVFEFTPKELGQYLLEVWIYDKEYRSKKITSEVFYAYEPEDRKDVTKLPGKVLSIVEEAKAKNFETEYDAALWLHDWLTHNAYYDEPMTIHTPEGVLLQGTGVCESYALAYHILLHEYGIDSVYATGYSRGELHAWDLVKIDGEWTYVDTTWDDPAGGTDAVSGNEGYDYFGMNDVLLGRDHDWTYGNVNVPPKAETLNHNYLLKNGAKPFSSEEELYTLLSNELTNKEPLISYTYHGSDKYFDVSYLMERWMKSNNRKFFVDTYQWGGSKFSGKMNVTYKEMDGYDTFADEEEFTRKVEEMVKSKPASIKMAYVGDDNYFDCGIFIRKWLDKNARRLFISSYSYTYYPSSVDITAEYTDVEGYTFFKDDAELAAALQNILDTKATEMKLYYTGDDNFYNLKLKVDDWLRENRDFIKNVGGNGYTGMDADLTLEWN